MDDTLYWLAATQLPGIGPVTLRSWLAHFNHPSALFSAKLAALKAAGLTDRQCAVLGQANWKKAMQIRDWSARHGCKLLTWHDPAYPPMLREIHDAPMLLYAQGDAALLSQPQLAIVGAREATPGGCETAYQLALDLAKAGLVITSGLARGIDGAGHRGALAVEGGRTIAVVGTGLQHVYPALHRTLYKKILAAGGAIVSELAPDTPPRAYHFPLRNRLISGLACGVLVVEAAARSGSLITARYALEHNREVFAVPGSIHNPKARGCHDLIRQGAKLIDSVQDILTEIRVLARMTLPAAPEKEPVSLCAGPDARAQKVLDQVGYEVTAQDVIIARTGLTAAEVSSILLTLELSKNVAAVPGGYVRSSAYKRQ